MLIYNVEVVSIHQFNDICMTYSNLTYDTMIFFDALGTTNGPVETDFRFHADKERCEVTCHPTQVGLAQSIFGPIRGTYPVKIV